MILRLMLLFFFLFTPAALADYAVTITGPGGYSGVINGGGTTDGISIESEGVTLNHMTVVNTANTALNVDEDVEINNSVFYSEFPTGEVLIDDENTVSGTHNLFSFTRWGWRDGTGFVWMDSTGFVWSNN